jgi:hypothetical protein
MAVLMISIVCSKDGHTILTTIAETTEADPKAMEWAIARNGKRLLEQLDADVASGRLPCVCPFCGIPKSEFGVLVQFAKPGVTKEQIERCMDEPEASREAEAAEAMRRRKIAAQN